MSKTRLLFIVWFSILGVLLLFIIALILAVVLRPKKTPVGPISTPTAEIKKEWFKTEKGQNYDITEDKKPYLNQGKWIMPGINEEGTTMIEVVYTFYGLEGLGYYEKKLKEEIIKEEKKQKVGIKKFNNVEVETFLIETDEIIKLKKLLNTQKEPTDLAYFVKYPFDQWKDGGVDYFNNFTGQSLADNTKSFFSGKASSNLFQERNDHKFEFHFKGPKYLLDLDQDCFIYPVNTPINVRNSGVYDTYQRKPYYLHLNPVRKTLSLYTEKFNTGEEYKPLSD